MNQQDEMLMTGQTKNRAIQGGEKTNKKKMLML